MIERPRRLVLWPLLIFALVVTGLAGCSDDARPGVDPDVGTPWSDGGTQWVDADAGVPTGDAGSVAEPEEPGLQVWSELFRNARGNTVSLAPNGDVVVAGFLQEPVDFGAGPTEEDWAGYVVRFAPDGAYRWARTFDGSVFPHASVVDDEGNVFIAGSFRGSVSFGGESLSGGTYDGSPRSQAFVASFDQEGNHRWSADYGGRNHDDLSSIALTSDGGIAVTGSAFGSIDFGGGDLRQVGSFGSNVVVASFDGNGEHRWSHLFGTGGELEFDEGRGIAATRDGGVIITGAANGGIDFGGGELALDRPDSAHPFVAAFDARGEHRFSQVVEPMAPFRRLATQDIALSPGGDRYFLTGYGHGSGSSGQPYLATYAMEGELVWSLVGSEAGFGASLVADEAGVALVGGSDRSMNFGEARLEGDGRYVFVLAFDDLGGHRWSTTLDAADGSSERNLGIAVSPTRLAVTTTLAEGVSSFEGAPVSLEEEAMTLHVFTR